MSHLLHGEKKSLTEPYYENLLKEVTKTKTMGAPHAPPPATTMPHKAQSARALGGASSSLAGSERALQRKAGGGGSAAYLPVENFRSKIPMKWAVGSGAMSSSYMVRLHNVLSRRALCSVTDDTDICVLLAPATDDRCHGRTGSIAELFHNSTLTCVQDSIGASAQQAGKAAKSRLKGFVPTVITSPYGAVDPITDVSRFERYLVPEGLVQASIEPFTDPGRNPPETVNRMAFQKRSDAEGAAALRAARAQAEESAKVKVLAATARASRSHASACTQANALHLACPILHDSCCTPTAQCRMRHRRPPASAPDIAGCVCGAE
jgi:hypothetical protein